ncbi:YitT family protein [Paenibacillus glucanolyticus]|uniref:YitT family protein n=1 Tax=Paenibacillus glucanolyticus TaxID=59843 RepID=UPI0034CE4A56
MKKFGVTTFSLFSCGIFILALGVSLTILSQLGASPFDALLVGLSKNVGLTVGSWEVLIAILLIGCNLCLSRHRPEILGMVTALITGLGIDLWIFLLKDLIEPKLWISKLSFLGLGLILIGLGTSIYLHANFAPIPVDRLTLVLQTITGLNILFTRTIIYLFFLIAAIIFNGPIGIGTLLTVCLGGLTLNYFMPLTQKTLNLLIKTSGHT